MKVSYPGVGILVHRRIATIKPYTAKASHKATTRNALKNASSLSDRAEIAAVPTVFIAHALPNTAELTEIATAIARNIVVVES
jgi:hypothetical protein